MNSLILLSLNIMIWNCPFIFTKVVRLEKIQCRYHTVCGCNLTAAGNFEVECFNSCCLMHELTSSFNQATLNIIILTDHCVCFDMFSLACVHLNDDQILKNSNSWCEFQPDYAKCMYSISLIIDKSPGTPLWCIPAAQHPCLLVHRIHTPLFSGR